ncbi:MAG: hypothetical protein A2Z14_10955 [Chloroflexi bacterium RBG_16_48_8]|nr:MAG: hypothetical protein A2Z14_10955 [Chloroflexi bacterium RBG_16_48_8]
MEIPNVLVIGAGIGGIAVAANLARRGCRVTVVEKNDQPGGRCSRLMKDGHYFDVGPTLFVMPEVYFNAFSDLGERIEDYLDLRRIDPTYHLFFDDGTTLALTSDLRTMHSQLESFEAGSFQKFLCYLDEGCRHYQLSLPRLVDRDFRSLLEYIHPKNLPLFIHLKALANHYPNVGRYFRDPRLKAAFTFQDMYCGLSPYEAVATFSLLSYIEIVDGVWFPMGGMYSVVEALKRIAENRGCQFLFNTAVKRIDIEDTRAKGVTLEDGQRLEADVIVANADLPYVYLSLLPDTGLAARMKKKRYSCSTISFFWGIDKTYAQLAPHNLFLSDDYKENFDSIIKDLTMPENPSIYVHAPARIDPSRAPAGQDSIIAIVPVGHLDEGSGQDWDEIRNRARQAVFHHLTQIGIRDLDRHLKFEICVAPQDWQRRFNLIRGATHGLSHTRTQMFYFRPRNRHHRYRNLFFVGASTHPGTGIPCVLISARLAAERILQDR